MNTGGSLAVTRAVLCAGALMLAGAFSDTNLALAQVACPLPAGMAPLAPPRVTAQQVEDGSATLMEFALAARDRYISAGQELRSLEEAAYLQCRVREEGSPWRFRFHLPRVSDAGRQGLRTREVHGAGREEAGPGDLWRDPPGIGNRSGQPRRPGGVPKPPSPPPPLEEAARSTCPISQAHQAMPPCWRPTPRSRSCSPGSRSMNLTWP